MTPFPLSRRALMLGLLGAGALPAAASAAEKVSAAGPLVLRVRPAPFYTAHVLPGGTIYLSQKALFDQGRNVIALTFDDGPDPVNDREILRILADLKATATFFMIGQRAARNLDVVQEIAAAGHEIGNHTWSHPMLTTLTPDHQVEELRRTVAVLASAGIQPKWFRPPYGDYDSLTLQIAHAENMETVLWSVDSRDFTGRASDKLVAGAAHDFHPGAVALFHSIKKNTVAALPEIIQQATSAGYRFVTMSEWKSIMIEADSALNLAQQQQATAHAAMTR